MFMKKKLRNIILLIFTAILFVAIVLMGFLTNWRYADPNSVISAEGFLPKASDNTIYIPYGINLPSDTDETFAIVESPNASLIIETEERTLIDDNGIQASLVFLDGTNTNYEKGLFRGDATISLTDEPDMPGNKNSYEFSLVDTAALLNMAYDRDWTLISLENDKTMLRTYTGLELSKLLGMKYTPQIRFVELFVNGRYDGTYMLCEKVKISTGRLNIEKASPDIITGAGVTGGYLMYTDMSTKAKDELTSAGIGKNFYFTMANSNILPGATGRSRLKFRHTKDLMNVHFSYISDYMQEAESVLFSENFMSEDGFRKYFLEDSVVDWYIIEELFKNPNDPQINATYMYKVRNAGISLGPVWYFGASAGNSDFNEAIDTSGWYVRQNSWISRMFEDPEFEELFKYEWNTRMDGVFEKLLEKLDSAVAEQSFAARYNDISEEEYWQEVGLFREWIVERFNWIGQNI